MKKSQWRNVTPAAPCPVCGKDSWCSVSDDASTVVCRRVNAPHPDFHPPRERQKGGGTYYVYRSRRVAPGYETFAAVAAAEVPADRGDCSDLAAGYEGATAADPTLFARLLAQLNLPAWGAARLTALGVGYIPAFRRYTATFTFRERAGDGTTIGLSTREDGGEQKKRMVSGTHRGLTYAADWFERAVRNGVVFLVEGASDVLACSLAGLAVVGRPSNVGGVADLVRLLRGLPAAVQVVVVGENDVKYDRRNLGKWPGRMGAAKTAALIAEGLRGGPGAGGAGATDLLGHPPGERHVYWSLVPAGFKDAREYLTRHAKPTGGPRRWEAVGAKLAAKLVGTAAPAATRTPGDVAADVLDTLRRPACPTPYFISLAGEKDTPAEGRRCVAAARCRRWVCEACAGWKVWHLYRHVGEVFTTLTYPDSAKAENPLTAADLDQRPVPGDAGHLRDTGPWGTFLAVVSDGRFRQIRQHVNSKGGEWVKVGTTATADDVNAAVGRNLLLNTRNTEDYSSKTKEQVSRLRGAGSEAVPVVVGGGEGEVGGDGGAGGDDSTTDSDSPPRPTMNLVAVVLPVNCPPPRGFVPVSSTEWLWAVAAALRSLPAAPKRAGGRLDPVHVSKGFAEPEEERAKRWRLNGNAAYSPPVVKKITDQLKVTTPVVVGGKNIQGKAAGWRAPEVLSFVLGELVRKPDGRAGAEGTAGTAAGEARAEGGGHERPPNPPEMVVAAYRAWERAIPAGTPLGPEVERLVRLYLWSGPPRAGDGYDFRDELAAGVKADGELAAEAENRRRLRREYNPDLLSPDLREKLFGDGPAAAREASPPAGATPVKSRPPIGGRHAPKWRAKNLRLSWKGQQIMDTIGG